MNHLEAFSVLDPGREAASDVGRHMMTAERDRVGMDQLAFSEDRDRRHTAAHVDRGAAKLDFIVDQCSKTARIGSSHDTFDNSGERD